MSGKRLKALRQQFFEANGRYPRRSRLIARTRAGVSFKSEWREVKRAWRDRGRAA